MLRPPIPCSPDDIFADDATPCSEGNVKDCITQLQVIHRVCNFFGLNSYLSQLKWLSILKHELQGKTTTPKRDPL